MITVVFGDSIAKGIVTTKGSMYTAKDNAVSIVSKYYDQAITNVSRYGQTVKRLDEKKIVDKFIKQVDKQKEKFAIISLGGNDSDFDWKEVSMDPDFNHLPKTPLAKFVSIYEKLIIKLKNNGFGVVLMTVFPIDSSRYFNNVIEKIADPNEVLKFLKGDVEQIKRFQEKYNNEVVQLAKKHKCILFDIRTKFLALPNYLDYICLDGVHPNEEGYKIISKFIIEKISRTKEFGHWVDFSGDSREQVV